MLFLHGKKNSPKVIRLLTGCVSIQSDLPCPIAFYAVCGARLNMPDSHDIQSAQVGLGPAKTLDEFSAPSVRLFRIKLLNVSLYLCYVYVCVCLFISTNRCYLIKLLEAGYVMGGQSRGSR